MKPKDRENSHVCGGLRALGRAINKVPMTHSCYSNKDRLRTSREEGRTEELDNKAELRTACLISVLICNLQRLCLVIWGESCTPHSVLPDGAGSPDRRLLPALLGGHPLPVR